MSFPHDYNKSQHMKQRKSSLATQQRRFGWERCLCLCATLRAVTLPTLRGGTEDTSEDVLGGGNEVLLWATRESVRERGRESKRD